MITCVVVVGRPLLYVVAKVITDHRTFHCVDKATRCGPFIPTSQNQRLSTLHLHRAGPIGRPRKLALFRPVTRQIDVEPT
jgi:hypothetical protein